MRKVFIFLFVLLTACTTASDQPDSASDRMLLIEHGNVYDSTTGTTTTASIVTIGGRITFIGPAAAARTQAGSTARIVDASGATILPGLVDAHGHLGGLGTSFDTVRLVGTTSLQAVLDLVRKRDAELPKGDWLLGRGWDQNDWPEKRFPTAADIDRVVAERPVFLDRVDGHAAVANTAALRFAGITASTPDPPGGKIVRDSNGNPTGVFIDNATALVESKIPRFSRERRAWQLAAATARAAELGLTGVHEAGADQEMIEILKELAAAGRLPIRVYVLLTHDRELLDRWFASGPLIDFEDRVTVRSVKMYADGALGSRGAALLEPYSDDPGNRGLILTPADQIADVTSRARKAGFQVATHAIGDRAVRVVLDSYEKGGVTPGDRARIEHYQVAHLDDIPRTAAMGVIASMQPTHATSDMYWAEQRVGQERIRGAYAWRSILRAGGRLAFGSDFPVEEVNPFLGFHAAVTRQDLKRWPEGGWRPEERVTLQETIDAFTRGAAYAAFEEERLGSIEVGKTADLTIVEGTLDPARLDETKVRHTIVNGDVVYSSRDKSKSSK